MSVADTNVDEFDAAKPAETAKAETAKEAAKTVTKKPPVVAKAPKAKEDTAKAAVVKKAEPEAAGMKVVLVDPTKLTIKPEWNARVLDTEAAQELIRELAHDIAQHGVKQPLRFWKEGDKNYISDGHRRLMAVMYARTLPPSEVKADLSKIPCIQEPRGMDELDLLKQQITLNSGEPMTPFEQGVVFKRMLTLDTSYTIETVAAFCARSISQVTNCLAVQEQSVAVKMMVKEGEVSHTLVADLARDNHDKKEVETLLTTAKEVADKAGKKVTKKLVEQVAQATQPTTKVSAPKSGNLLTKLKDIFENADIIDMNSGDAAPTDGRLLDDETFLAIRKLIGF